MKIFNLKTHIRTSHLKVKCFECQVCKASFFHKKSLNKHIKDKNHLQNPENNYSVDKLNLDEIINEALETD
jgi:hypothetical protein